MRLIFLLFLCYNAIAASDSEDSESDVDTSKYIDLLPEKEKQEFLETVAKRLMSSVKTKDSRERYRSGEELSDAQLNEHSDFVRQVLDDETKNLRRQRGDKEKEENDKVNIENSDKVTNKNEDEARIDFTLRRGNKIETSNEKELYREAGDKEEVKKETVNYHAKNPSGVVSDEKTSIEDILGAKKRPPRWIGEVRTEKYEEKKSNDSEYVQENAFSHLESYSQTSNSTEVQYNMSNIQLESRNDSATSVTELTIDQESTTKQNEDNNDTVLINDDSKEEKKGFRNIVIKYNEDKKKNIHNNTAKVTFSVPESTPIAKIHEVITENSKPEVTASTSYNPEETLSTVKYFENTTVHYDPTENIEHVTENKNVKNSTPSGINNENKIIKRSNIVTEGIPKDQSNKLVLEKATIGPLTTTEASRSELEIMATAMPTSLMTSDLNSNKSDDETSTVLSDFVKALRSGMQLHDHNDDDYKIHMFPTPSKNIKEYKVYEISPDENPFEEAKPKTQPTFELMRDQPFHVPVYNYDPKNAYYNAHNRLGPNADEDYDVTYERDDDQAKTDDSLESANTDEALRIFRLSKKKGYKEREAIKQISGKTMIRLPFIVKKRDIYIRPGDYLDLDYYFGRKKLTNKPIDKEIKNIIKIPNPEDKSHSYFENESVKSRLNKMRQTLYRNQVSRPTQIENRKPPVLNKPTTNFDGEEDLRELDSKVGKFKPKFYKLRTVGALEDLNDKFKVPNKVLKLVKDSNSRELDADYYFGSNKNGLNQENRFNLKLPTDLRTKNVDDAMQSGSDSQLDTSSVILSECNPDDSEKEVQPHFEEELKPFVNVLKDMIDMDNKALKQYDWLGTTVDVLSACTKLTSLGQELKTGQPIHPLDLNILKYVQYLYKTAKSSLEESLILSQELREVTKKEKKKKSPLPRNKRRKKGHHCFLNKGLMNNRVWLFRNKIQNRKWREIDEFLRFIGDLETALSDLHNAIKQIATITTYKKQNWYKNLKELYLNKPTRKKLLEVILHVHTTRLIGLIEESAREGLYSKFVEEKEEVARSKEELTFMMKVLREIKREV